MLEKVKERLQSLGYQVKETDTVALTFCIGKVSRSILHAINCTVLPFGLEVAVVERVCGEFLFALKQSGQANAVYALDPVVKSVTQGDTGVTFAGDSSSEQRLDALLAHLMTAGEGDLLCYRKLKW